MVEPRDPERWAPCGETDTLEKMQRRVEYDLAYIDGWSVTFDLKILMQTALSVLVDRNAF